MFGLVDMGRLCQETIAEVECGMRGEFEKHEKVNDINLEKKIVPFRGHHLSGFQDYILRSQRPFDYEKYGKLIFQKEYEFYENLLRNKLDVSLKIVENEPDFICNLGCWKRKPSCFTDFDANAEDYDKKIAAGFGFKIDQMYSMNEVIEKLKTSSFK